MSAIFRRGAGFDQALTGLASTEATLFSELQDRIDTILEALNAALNETSDLITDVIVPFSGLDITDRNLKDFQLNNSVIINSDDDFNKSDLITMFSIEELSSLRNFPYLLGSGTFSNVTGTSIDTWKNEKYYSDNALLFEKKSLSRPESTYYNKESGLVMPITLANSSFNISYSKIKLTGPNTSTSNDDVPIGEVSTSSLNSNSYDFSDTLLSTIIFKALNINRLSDLRKNTLEKLQAPTYKLRQLIQGKLDKINEIKAYKNQFSNVVKNKLPFDKINRANAAINDFRKLKQDLICFYSGVGSEALSIANNIKDGQVVKTLMENNIIPSELGAVTSSETASILLNQVRNSLASCFDLSWLMRIILNFINSVKNLILNALNLLANLFDFDSSGCGSVGNETKFMYDICGIGLKVPISNEIDDALNSAVSTKDIDPIELEDAFFSNPDSYVQSVSALTIASSSVDVNTELSNEVEDTENLKNLKDWESGDV